MRKLSLPTLVFFFLISCNGSGEKIVTEVPKVGNAKVVAVYTKRDGTKTVDILLRVIFKNIKFDSVSKKDNVIIDTVYGFPMTIKQVDSVGNILKARDGKDSINPQPQYVPIPKDSVNTFVSNIPIDSLLKK